MMVECPVHVSDGFPKNKILIEGWVDGASSINVFANLFNFANPLTQYVIH